MSTTDGPGAGRPTTRARRPAVPRFSCPDCGRLIAATTPAPYALGQHATYHYLRRHRGTDGGWCPARAVVHPCRLAVVPGGGDAADDR